MSDLISIHEYPVKDVLGILLADKTTRKNIIWATDAYSSYGAGFSDRTQITTEALLGNNSVTIQPRIEKALEEQQLRTRKKAEVFTPVWLCNKMNNYCDEEWFGRKDVFNVECSNNQWDVVDAKITFPVDTNPKLKNKDWKHYVDSRRLEITCGEAPYLVSRYDAASGNIIFPLFRRIGILDRKMRIVNENASTDDEWRKWALRAVQSCYGYEYQGDSLLIARINVLITYTDYYRERFGDIPAVNTLRKVANIISWNLWQMDGLKDTIPLGKPIESFDAPNLFELFPEAMGAAPTPAQETDVALPCRIFNWRAKASLEFRACKDAAST